MAVAEITEDTTKDEIEAFVDQIEADRAGDEPAPAPAAKTDAEIVNDVASIETPAPPRGDDSADAPSKGQGEATSDRSWLDDDLKAEVAAYGIGEDELADFTSREELDRALRLFDKSALEAGRKALAEGKADGESKAAARDDKGRFTKTETPAAPEERPAREGRYEIKLSKDVYDDALVDELTQMRDHYEDRLGALEARFLAADAQAEEERFDAAVDKLDMPKLFGKSGSESKEELEKRKDLHVAVKAQMIGLEALGRPAQMGDALVSRVARMVFAEEFGKKDLKSRTGRIQRQSNSRQGGGATRPNDPRESAREEADRLFRQLSGQ